MFRLGHQLFKGRSLERTLGEIRNGILRYSSDRAFARGLEQADVDWYRWRGLRYMLYEYEQHLAEQAGQAVQIPWEELESRKEDTIEHILPQTMDQGGYWAQRFTPEEHKRYVHDIGNLTLTFDNSALGNKSFPAKKGAPGQSGCYAGSKLFIEQQLARHNDWTETEILARREEIGEWATARWHVESAGLPPADARELALRVLTRRFIHRGQVLLYKVLYEAGETGVPYDELPERMGIRTDQISGVMGALGNRINRTEGLKDQSPGTAFLLRWDVVDGVGTYFMRPELKDAIESLPKLREVLANWSDEQIRTRYAEVWNRNRSAQRDELELPYVA
jgi:hypothetical protein